MASAPDKSHERSSSITRPSESRAESPLSPDGDPHRRESKVVNREDAARLMYPPQPPHTTTTRSSFTAPPKAPLHPDRSSDRLPTTSRDSVQDPSQGFDPSSFQTALPLLTLLRSDPSLFQFSLPPLPIINRYREHRSRSASRAPPKNPSPGSSKSSFHRLLPLLTLRRSELSFRQLSLAPLPIANGGQEHHLPVTSQSSHQNPSQGPYHDPFHTVFPLLTLLRLDPAPLHSLLPPLPAVNREQVQLPRLPAVNREQVQRPSLPAVNREPGRRPRVFLVVNRNREHRSPATSQDSSQGPCQIHSTHCFHCFHC